MTWSKDAGKPANWGYEVPYTSSYAAFGKIPRSAGRKGFAILPIEQCSLNPYKWIWLINGSGRSNVGIIPLTAG